MKKLNLDIIIKILILLGFSVFYFKIIKDNEIILYVHPRMIPFAIFGMISMFIIALFLITDSGRNKKKKIKLKNYITFIIPLIMIFFMQNTSANSAVAASDANTNSNAATSTDSAASSNNSSIQNTDFKSNLISDNSDYELYSGKVESDGEGKVDKNKLDIKDNVIQINIKNFVTSLDEILGNPDKYKDKEIEMSGFVYKGKDLDLKENNFILGRFMMVCCAADLQVAGIECDSNKLGAYDNGTWVKVKGKIKTETSGAEVDPIIVAEQIEKDPNPDAAYVYPF